MVGNFNGHNLKNYDPGFPTFTLCGILMSQENRKSLVKAFENLKNDSLISNKIRHIKIWPSDNFSQLYKVIIKKLHKNEIT